MWQIVVGIFSILASMITRGITAASRGKWKERAKMAEQEKDAAHESNKVRDDVRRDINNGGLYDDDGYRRD